MTTEGKLKRAQMKHEKDLAAIKATRDLGLSLIDNPMVGLIAGITFLEYAERQGWGGTIITTTAEAGLIAVCTAKALGPALPMLGEAGAKAVGALL